MDNIMTRAWRMYQNRGMRGVLERVGVISSKNRIVDNYHFIVDTEKIPLDKEAFAAHENDEKILLNWVIPEAGEGSGGHTTIFRFISHLENLGFHSRIYLFCSINYRHNNEKLREFLADKFPILDSRVEAYWDVSEISFAHATFATSWETAYFVRNFDNTVSKFYFVQDYEPYFFAKGSFYELAENTYRFGLRAITAGDWLRDVMRGEFGMQADSFLFSYDKENYKPRKKRDERPRVFFYARPVTARRDFEIGMLALSELSKRIPDLEVIFAGWDLGVYDIPFAHRSLGIVTPAQLSKLYSQSDLCLVISNTNLSLLPIEIMASNSVAVCSKGPNSEWLVNDENCVLVDYDPVQIADTMEYYMTHPEELAKKRAMGRAFAKTNTTWEAEAEKVSAVLRKALAEDTEKLKAKEA